MHHFRPAGAFTIYSSAGFRRTAGGSQQMPPMIIVKEISYGSLGPREACNDDGFEPGGHLLESQTFAV